MLSRNLAAAFATTSIVAMATPAYAQTQEFNIPAGSLKAALDAYAKQTGRQVIYKMDEVQPVRSPGVSGPRTPDAALNAILSGTGFRANADRSGAIAIVRSATSGNVVQQAPEEPIIVVTGTNIKTADVAAPRTVIDRQEIENSGFNTTAEIFEALPQNLTELTAAGSTADGVSGIARANTENATAISLRGLGPQSTLTVVNGRRFPGAINGQVFDVSTLPLSVIERAEILTGGNSAVYGADAVAGVVNLVTRRNFDGAESEASYGFADAGAEIFRTSHTLGIDRERGGFLIAYEYVEREELDATEAGVIGPSPRNRVPVPGRFYLEPNSTSHSVYASGSYQISESITVFGDGLYSSRKNSDLTEYETPFFAFLSSSANEAESIVGTIGANIDFGDSWAVELTGTHGERQSSTLASNNFAGLGGTEADATNTQLTGVVSGRAFSLNGVDVDIALGGEYRHESLVVDPLVNPGPTISDLDREITSFFGEVNLPLVRDGSSPGLRRFELSAAIRYDHFSDFGDTVNPQFGVIWGPTNELTFRGTYASAFRAPSLFNISFAQTGNAAQIFQLPDPDSAGTIPTFILSGTAQGLGPETADTVTFGFDFEPSFWPDTIFSVSYFDIDFKNRIDQPAPATADILSSLGNPALVDQVNLNPTEAEVRALEDLVFSSERVVINSSGTPFDPTTQDYLTVFPNLAILDNRRQNLALQSTQGLDFSLKSSMDLGFGELDLGFNGVYYIESERSPSPNGEFVDLLNEPGKLVDFQFRTNAGFRSGAWGVYAFVNYVDGYPNTLVDPEQTVDEWVTADLTLRFDGSRLSNAGFMNKINASIAINNLFDSDPPFLEGTNFGVAYDAANASARGRFVTFRIGAKW